MFSPPRVWVMIVTGVVLFLGLVLVVHGRPDKLHEAMDFVDSDFDSVAASCSSSRIVAVRSINQMAGYNIGSSGTSYKISLLELRDMRVHVHEDDLSESDRLNGIQWSGTVTLEVGSWREKARLESGGVWTQWSDWRDIENDVVFLMASDLSGDGAALRSIVTGKDVQEKNGVWQYAGDNIGFKSLAMGGHKQLGALTDFEYLKTNCSDDVVDALMVAPVTPPPPQPTENYVPTSSLVGPEGEVLKHDAIAQAQSYFEKIVTTCGNSMVLRQQGANEPDRIDEIRDPTLAISREIDRSALSPNVVFGGEVQMRGSAHRYRHVDTDWSEWAPTSTHASADESWNITVFKLKSGEWSVQTNGMLFPSRKKAECPA